VQCARCEWPQELQAAKPCQPADEQTSKPCNSEPMPATALQTARTPNPREPARGKLDSLLFFGLSAVIIFGPLAFGAVEDWAIFTQEIATVVLLGVWVAQALLAQDSGFSPNPLYGPMSLLALIVTVQMVFRTPGYGYATLAA